MWEFLGWFVIGFLASGVSVALFFYAESFPYFKVRNNPRAFRAMALKDLTLRVVILALWIGPAGWVVWRYGWRATPKFYGSLSGLGSWAVIALALLFYSVYQNWRGNSNQLAKGG